MQLANRYIKDLFSALLLLVITALFGVGCAGERVVVKRHEEGQETSYAITDQDGNKISLTIYHTEINKGIISLHSDSLLPIAEQVLLLSKILDRIFKDKGRGYFHTLSVGRLIYAFGKRDMEMAKRLALAAHGSPLWDKARGRPVSGHENNFVRDIANEAMIYQELKDLFVRHSLAIKFACAEKVLIATPHDIPFGSYLRGHGVRDADKLPFDCLAWFSLEKLE